MSKNEHLYLQIANKIEYQIKTEVLKVGDKLPSLRTVALEKGVSMTTVQQAYFEIESRGLLLTSILKMFHKPVNQKLLKRTMIQKKSFLQFHKTSVKQKLSCRQVFLPLNYCPSLK